MTLQAPSHVPGQDVKNNRAFARVVQWLEHLSYTQYVVGSNPTSGTSRNDGTVYIAALEAVPERVAGSNPVSGTSSTTPKAEGSGLNPL